MTKEIEERAEKLLVLQSSSKFPGRKNISKAQANSHSIYYCLYTFERKGKREMLFCERKIIIHHLECHHVVIEDRVIKTGQFLLTFPIVECFV